MKKIRPKGDHLRFLYHYARGSEVLSYRPFFLMIEPTNACNLSCPMCPQSDLMQRKRGFMDLKLYRRILDQAEGVVQAVHLYHSGEPLLHPDLPEMLSLAREKGLYTIVNTNAALLSGERAEALIGAGLNLISISLDSFLKETYESIRRGAILENTLENVRTLARLKAEKKSPNPRIVLEMLSMEKTAGGENSFTREARAFGAEEVRIWKYHNWTEAALSSEKHEGMPRKYFPCEYPYTILSVLWEGTVVPCCLDYDVRYPLGNAAVQPLNEIWNGEPMRHLRRLHRLRKEDSLNLCRNCSFLTESKSYYTFYGKLFQKFSRLVGLARK